MDERIGARRVRSVEWLVPLVRVEELLAARDALVIDLRSPSEFAEDHVPGARNVPLFGDAERALVGTLYRQRSPEVAFEAGLELVLERVSALVGEIAAQSGRAPAPADLRARVLDIAAGGPDRMRGALRQVPSASLPDRSLVLHCWRGGMRSASVTALLCAIGFERVFALEGGYRRYRHEVMAELERWRAPRSFVLRGLTGVGKTLVLRELERLRPSWTVDLEALAGHRSSILGMVGLEPLPQRAFESALAARLRRGVSPFAVFEGESRKVGDVVVPASVWSALDGGENLLLVADRERRIDVLIEDYLAAARPENRAALRERLPFIEARLGSKRWGGELVGLLDAGEERELVAILLERYYDPLYRHSEKGRNYAVEFDASDPARAAAEIVEWIEHRG